MSPSTPVYGAVQGAVYTWDGRRMSRHLELTVPDSSRDNEVKYARDGA